MSGAKFYRTLPPVPERQADAIASQAAPVQNTWYDFFVLAGLASIQRNVSLDHFAISVSAANETLEVRVITDLLDVTANLACTAATIYKFKIKTNAVTQTAEFTNSDYSIVQALGLNARSCQILFRKTTATGAGTITARLMWSKW